MANNFIDPQVKTSMKQLLSMPSTKPEQFLYTDFSVVTTADNPKLAITNILNYIKNVLKLRTYLCFRDVEQLFQSEPSFFSLVMGADSAEELWKKLAKNEQAQLQEREIIGFLTKIVICLTKLKNEYAETKRFEKFAEVKYAIEWLEDRVVDMETVIRDKIKEAAVKKRTEKQMKRQIEFEEGADYLKEKLEVSLQNYETELLRKHKKEDKIIEKVTEQRVRKEGYLFRPSKQLQQAKEVSLLAKLAPYKSQKKRPFECKSLQNKLSMTVEKGKQKMEQEMEEFKQAERQRVKRRHALEREVYLRKMEDKNSQALARLEIRKSELDKSENIKMQKLIEENNKMAKQRVESLRRSLRAYSMRDESKQIGQITKNHRETIQFVNNIEDIADTSQHQALLSPKYATLDVLSDWTRERRASRYSSQRLQSKIIRRIKKEKEAQGDGQELGSGRKSLVDLYDHELKQV